MKVVTKDNKTFYLPGAGHIGWFAAEVVPEGYLECNGAAISRTAYPELFSIIGTTYGSGDGSTTFNLPDLRGRFPEGADGGNVGATKAPGLPELSGGLGMHQGNSGSIFSTNTGVFRRSQLVNVYRGLAGIQNVSGVNSLELVDFRASSSNAIYGASATVQPPALTLLPCIKY